MSQPWFKFYPTDWRSDPRLRMCSMAARGLWVEMIALMHEATPYGHLLVSGHSPTDAQLAVLAGAPSDQIPDLISELESAGVFSRTKESVIYSRKMTRMAKKSAAARRNGKSGGNPSLSKQSKNPALDNQQDKPPDKPQKPETRNQNEKDIPKGISKKTPRKALLEVLDGETADAVIEHRRRKRSPLTVVAAERLAANFLKCPDPNEAALTMIEHGWSGCKPEWIENVSRGQSSPQGNLTDLQRLKRGLNARKIMERNDEPSRRDNRPDNGHVLVISGSAENAG